MNYNFTLNKSPYKKNLNFIASFEKVIKLCKKSNNIENIKIEKDVKNTSTNSYFIDPNSAAGCYKQFVRYRIFNNNSFVFSFVIAFYEVSQKKFNKQEAIGLFLFNEKQKKSYSGYLPISSVFIDRTTFIKLSKKIDDLNLSLISIDSMYELFLISILEHQKNPINLFSIKNIVSTFENKTINSSKKSKTLSKKINDINNSLESTKEEINKKIVNSSEVSKIDEQIKNLENEINKLKSQKNKIIHNLNSDFSYLYNNYNKDHSELTYQKKCLENFIDEEKIKIININPLHNLLNFSTKTDNIKFIDITKFLLDK